VYFAFDYRLLLLVQIILRVKIYNLSKLWLKRLRSSTDMKEVSALQKHFYLVEIVYLKKILLLKMRELVNGGWLKK
jgi:hypothetical protein